MRCCCVTCSSGFSVYCFIPVLNECNPAVRANIKSKSKSSVCCACKQGVECDVHRRVVDDEVVRHVPVITLLFWHATW